MKEITSCRGLIVQEGRVLLIQRFKDNLEYWIFPGGHTEPGESIEQTVAREIFEETGLNVTKIIEISEYDHPKWGTHEAVAICCVEPGELRLGGPEVDRNSSDNYYKPVWVEVRIALSHDNLYPDPIREIFRSRYRL